MHWKAKIPNKTCTAVDASVSRLSHPLLGQKDASTSPFPQSLKSCDSQAGLLGAPAFSRCLCEESISSLDGQASGYCFRMEFSPFLGLLHLPFLQHRKTGKISVLRLQAGTLAALCQTSPFLHAQHGSFCVVVTRFQYTDQAGLKLLALLLLQPPKCWDCTLTRTVGWFVCL